MSLRWLHALNFFSTTPTATVAAYKLPDTMQVTKNARSSFFTVLSMRRDAVCVCVQFFTASRTCTLHKAHTYARALAPNLFDTINWHQVSSKCDQRSEHQRVDAERFVRVTLTTHEAPRANECHGLCVCVFEMVRCGVQNVVLSLSAHKSWFLLTPFARFSSRSLYFDHFFAPKINS